MDWHIEVELVGQLTDEQLEQAAEGAVIIRYNSQTGVLVVQGKVTADDYRQAAHSAEKWTSSLSGVQALISAGALAEPRRLLVETVEAHARGWELIGAAEIAERLGVSTARVRQLEQRPDWPAPALDLAGGRIYRAEDVDAFNRGWDRRPGRPRKASSSEA